MRRRSRLRFRKPWSQSLRASTSKVASVTIFGGRLLRCERPIAQRCAQRAVCARRCLARRFLAQQRQRAYGAALFPREFGSITAAALSRALVRQKRLSSGNNTLSKACGL